MRRPGRWWRLAGLLLTLFSGLPAVAQAPAAFGLEDGFLDAPWSEEPEVQRAALRPAEVTGAPADVARFDHYRLAWRLDAEAGAIDGRLALQFENRRDEPQQALRLQRLPELLGASLELQEVRVDGVPVEPEARDGWWTRVPLPAPLSPGERAVARLRYRVHVPSGAEAHGFGLLARSDDGVWSLAHALPLRLPQGRPPWRPSLDGDVLAAEAATYRLRVHLPQGWTMVASGSRADGTPSGAMAGAAASLPREVVTGPSRDLYVQLHEPGVAAQVEGSEMPVAVRGHAREVETVGMRAAVSDAAVTVRAMEAAYGPYPYRELDLAPLDTPALGVEFPGVALLAGSLLERGESATLRSTVVHEVAHQWFYGLVGSDQVRTPWVDEGLAQYATLRILETHFGSDEARAFRRVLVDNWRGVDFAPRPFDRPVAAFEEGAYVPIVYGRVPLLLEAAAERIGPERFDALVREWVAEHRFERVDGSDLRARIERACGCRLEALEPDLGDEPEGGRRLAQGFVGSSASPAKGMAARAYPTEATGAPARRRSRAN